MTRKHRRHSTAEKREIVEAYFNGESMRGLSEKFDVSRTLIPIWVENGKHGGVLRAVELGRGRHGIGEDPLACQAADKVGISCLCGSNGLLFELFRRTEGGAAWPASAPATAGGAQQCPDEPAFAVENDDRLEAELVVERIEQAQLLMAMHRVKGTVDNEHDPAVLRMVARSTVKERRRFPGHRSFHHRPMLFSGRGSTFAEGDGADVLSSDIGSRRWESPAACASEARGPRCG